MLKSLMGAALTVSAVVASAPASAATYTVTSTNATQAGATQINQEIDFVDVGDGVFTGGTTDNLVNRTNTTRYFSLNYALNAPVFGAGAFGFQTTSTAPAALTVLGFIVNGVNTAFMTTIETVRGVTTTKYSGVEQFSGPVQSFSVFGSLSRGGTVSTTTSFAAAVPEISTWFMMMAGIGMLGGALRVSRRKVRFQVA